MSDTILCRNCGAVNAAHSHFCDQCSAPLYDETAAGAPASPLAADSYPAAPSSSTPRSSVPRSASSRSSVPAGHSRRGPAAPPAGPAAPAPSLLVMPRPPLAGSGRQDHFPMLLIGGAVVAIALFVGIGLSALFFTSSVPAVPPTATPSPSVVAAEGALTATAAADELSRLQATLTAISQPGSGTGVESTATPPSIPPSATPEPPTATVPPPSATPEPPTATTAPPSATPEPPTATAALPTATTPPGDIPATPTETRPPAPSCGTAPVIATPPAPIAAGQDVLLSDLDFQGGYRYTPGKTYQGQTAVWIYGQGSCYSSMTAPFQIMGRPDGQAYLAINGMDSEYPDKAEIRILINGQEVYRGADLLPDTLTIGAGLPGAWATISWPPFPAAVLQPGDNTLTIENLTPSDRNIPWVMVHSAEIRWDTQD